MLCRLDVRDAWLSNVVPAVHAAAELFAFYSAVANLNQFSDLTTSSPPIGEEPGRSPSHKLV